MLTKIAVTLTPVLQKIAPEVLVSVPAQIHRVVLHETTKVNIEFDSATGFLQIDFFNKPELDQHMAVIVDRVEFFGIADPRFVWQGVYTPKYPEPWYSQQTTKPPIHLPQQNYMGWNGCWRLDFDIPVFTWMHKTMNLGWLYQ